MGRHGVGGDESSLQGKTTWPIIYNKRRKVQQGTKPVIILKNVILWDINTQFVLHRRHITSPLQSPANQCYVRFEVFTAVTMKNVVFWDIKTQFVLHRRHIASPLQSPAS
jgi:hypothetical protein